VNTGLLVFRATFLTVRILWRVYSEQLCNGGRDIDVVDFFQAAALEIRSGGGE
jgi:hypothetical protein